MSVLTAWSSSRRSRRTAVRHCPPPSPLPQEVRERIRLSAEALAALLEVEGRDRPTLDDIEWADAVAARLLRRDQHSGQRDAG